MTYGLAGPRNQIEWNKWNLDAFWEEVKIPRQMKNSGYLLAVLKEFSNRTIPPYCFKRRPYEKARKTKGIIRLRARKKYSACFCCFKVLHHEDLGCNSVIHHILAIKNGGLDLKSNRTVLCNLCHSKIHPWLTSQGTKKVNAFELKKEEKDLDNAFKNAIGEDDG